jgi:hypothetical protein
MAESDADAWPGSSCLKEERSACMLGLRAGCGPEQEAPLNPKVRSGGHHAGRSRAPDTDQEGFLGHA